MESTVSKVKPSRNKPASSLGMLRVTSAVRAKAAKAAVLAPAAKASLMRVAVLPVASWCVTGVSFISRIANKLAEALLHYISG